MVWVVKFKDGQYHMNHYAGTIHSGVASERARATRFVRRSEALRAASIWGDDLEPRIVRMKPRVKLDEAAVRKSERERIAAAMTVTKRSPDTVWLGDRAIIIGAAHPDQWAAQCKQAIIALDWKPEQK